MVFGLFIVGAMSFAIFEPIQVLPRMSLGPGYSFMNADGDMITSEDARGTVTLYTFAPTDCGTECDALDATMRDVAARVPTEANLGDSEFRQITIALNDAPSVAELTAAAERSGANGVEWQWVGGGADQVRNVVGGGFDRYYETEADGSFRFDPGFILVDGNGVIRGQYRYQTLADDSDKLVNHIGILGQEIRYASGATAVAYEAAHLFLCYP